jgi:hypothetical protein
MLRLPKAAPDVGIEALLWQPPSPKALKSAFDPEIIPIPLLR